MPITFYHNEQLIRPMDDECKKKMFARVIWEYEAENKQELSVIKGEYVEVLDNTKDWWKVRGLNNRVGYIPGTYAVVVQLPEE
uniref:SH3 domain-containing protein n=1 Tax=Acrobeloides nanus TaxID=290746 RepID=A0A914CEX7_9BILA